MQNIETLMPTGIPVFDLQKSLKVKKQGNDYLNLPTHSDEQDFSDFQGQKEERKKVSKNRTKTSQTSTSKNSQKKKT